MPCILVVKNTPNSFRRGEVITILESESQLTDGLDKALYEQSHGAGTWDRRFVLVIVVDKNKDDPEIKILLEDTEDGTDRRKHIIAPQGEDSPFYQQLLDTAKVTVNYQILSSLII